MRQREMPKWVGIAVGGQEVGQRQVLLTRHSQGRCECRWLAGWLD